MSAITVATGIRAADAVLLRRSPPGRNGTLAPLVPVMVRAVRGPVGRVSRIRVSEAVHHGRRREVRVLWTATSAFGPAAAAATRVFVVVIAAGPRERRRGCRGRGHIVGGAAAGARDE